MTHAVQHIVRAADTAVAGAYLSFFTERNAMMAFLFHSIFRNEEEMARNLADPLDYTTVAKFRAFVEYYLNHGYEFIGLDALQRGLEKHKKYALVTFDDGYFNNTLILPILEEFGVPALFFISTDNVRENKCFWWDVLYRERIARGASPAEIQDETLELKSLRTHEIEQRLTRQFGPDALRPRTDVDRPFTPSELREFARSPFVSLGNHTANHAILTNYAPDQMKEQVRGAQDALREMTGVESVAIAYPNGAHNDAIIATSAELGLKYGFTVRPQKTPLPVNGDSGSLLTLGRFCFHGENGIGTQCRTYRSDLQLYGMFRSGYVRLTRGQVTR